MATPVTAKQVGELRQRTGAGMMECKKALEETGADIDKAVEHLRAKGIAKADKRAGRDATEGLIKSYIHHNHKVGVLIEVNCETDFVARTEDFKTLVHELSLHIASAAPLAVDRDGISADVVARERRIAEQAAKESGKPPQIVEKMVEGKVEAFFKDNVLLSQPWVKETSKTVGDLVKETIAKTGENIVVRRFTRYQLGGE